jgi:signal transduction histidine kinase
VIELGLIVAAVALALALRLLPTVRLQLVGLAVLAVGLPLAAVILSGAVMFHMHDDVAILAVSAASASSAFAAALLLGAGIGRHIRGLETAAEALSSGELTARAPTQAPRELTHLGEAFNTMAASIESLFDARRQLIAWASHDLRTPVASIQAMLDAVEDGLATTDEYLPALRQQARTLALLIDDLFELARIDTGALTLELREAQLPQLVSDCMAGLEAEARARQIRLESHLDERLPDVRCAPEHVQRVLLNLVTNALRHTPSDGSIVVRAQRQAGELEVSVPALGSRPRPSGGCSSGSGAGTPRARARAAEPGSGWRSHAASSRRRAAGSGPRTGPKGAHASRSRSRSSRTRPAGCRRSSAPEPVSADVHIRVAPASHARAIVLAAGE